MTRMRMHDQCRMTESLMIKCFVTLRRLCKRISDQGSSKSFKIHYFQILKLGFFFCKNTLDRNFTYRRFINGFTPDRHLTLLRYYNMGTKRNKPRNKNELKKKV